MTIDTDDKKGSDVIDDSLDLDSFDLVFEEAAELSPSGEEKPVEEKPAEEKPVEEKPAEEKPVEEKPKAEEKPAVKTEVQIRADILAEQTVTTAQTKKDDDAKAARAAMEAKTELTDEEKTTFEAEQKDFPGLSKMIAAVQRTAEAKFDLKLADLKAEMQANLQPIIETSNAVASNSFEVAVLKGHSDALDLLPTVREWAATQPAFLAAAYSDALQTGTAQDVIDVFTAYKGTLAPAAGTDTGPTAEELAAKQIKDDEVAAAKKKKLDSMSSVKTAATQRTDGIDENDFEGAFEQAAAAMS